MATKPSPKGGSGEQKAAAPPQEAKEKEPPKETVKDDKANPKAGGKDPPKEGKDANKKPVKDEKKEPGQGGGGGGSHERGRGGRQEDLPRGRDRGRRTSRDHPDHRGHDKEDREVCRNFLHNRCDRGSLCKYYHPRSTSRPRHGPDNPEQRRSSPTHSPGTGQIVCRDFVRNMCARGTECRFYHPPSESSDKKRQGSWLTFCHDFRNGHCLRNDCRFFHITREDEESYRGTGEIPIHIVDQAVRKAMVLDGAFSGTRPTCKEFLRGLCNMQNCRFRHLTQREYEDEVFHALQDEFENILGPPDRQPNSPQVVNPYGTISNFHDAPQKYGAPMGDFREDVLPPEDMRGPLMPMSEYESEAKRPRYFSGDAMFPREDFRDGVDAPRKWDERMDYDRMERPELNAPDAYRLQPELYALRNENGEIRHNAEREINELKEEVRRALEENAGLHHEVAKMRATAVEEALIQKATIDKLSLTNNTLMENLRKAEDTARRMEHESRENMKVMDAKQKNNSMELERKIDSLQKEVLQLHDALSKAVSAHKKAEDEKARLLNELDDVQMKVRGPGGAQSMRKDSQQQQHGTNSNYNTKNVFPRDMMKERGEGNFPDMLHGERRPPDMRDQDMRGPSSRGAERYSPDIWGSADKNGRALYDDNSSGYGPRGGAPEGDRSRSWHGGPPHQDSWSPHGGAKASSGSLMGEYQGDDRMRGPPQTASLIRGPSYSSQGGDGLLDLPIERTPQGGTGSQMGMDGKYTGQGLLHFEERDYGLSGYDADARGGQFGHSQRPQATWQQAGGDGGRGRGLSHAWRREKQF